VKDPLAHVMAWSKEDVHKWIVNELKLDADDADKLREQEVDGEALLVLTEEKLIKPPYELPGGAATKLASAVAKLKALVPLGMSTTDALQVTNLPYTVAKLQGSYDCYLFTDY